MTAFEFSPAAELPTDFGSFRIVAIRDQRGQEHALLIKGDVRNVENVLIRIHSECLTGDAFGSRRCDCGAQLHGAMAEIGKTDAGMILYLRQEGRGIGFFDKIRAYQVQDGGHDTVDANVALGLPIDARDYGLAAAIIRELGVLSVRMLTNNPRKVEALVAAGVKVAEVRRLAPAPTEQNTRYLNTKRDKLGHTI